MKLIVNDWMDAIGDEFQESYFSDLFAFINEENSHYDVYPNQKDIFNAFHFTPLSNVKVVIIGQDPYHNENQANGLCFSVKKQVDIPPSLRNIYKELQEDVGGYIPNHGLLIEWADQGVLLLNSVLTVRAHQAASHKGKGWETFTDKVLEKVNELDRPIAFILWGKPAQMKKKLLTNPKHLIIESPHPSPLSAYRGFFGSKPFSQVNKFLAENRMLPIDWQIHND